MEESELFQQACAGAFAILSEIPFGAGYNEWTRNRVKELVIQLGDDWFKGKRILEVGSGHGSVTRILLRMGSDPGSMVTDARHEYIDALRKIPNETINAHQMDQNEPWKIADGELGKFDLIVHFGVHYHLTNWRQDLECAVKHSNLICLETDVAKWDDPDYETIQIDEGYDQAISGSATRISEPRLINYLKQLGCEVQILNSSRINYGGFSYDWTPTPKPVDDPEYSPTKWIYNDVNTHRRMYMIRHNSPLG